MSTEPNNSIDWEQQRGHVNLDLLRENAELRASRARLREALEAIRAGHWEAKLHNSWEGSYNRQWGKFKTEQDAETAAKQADDTNDTGTNCFGVYVTDLDSEEILKLCDSFLVETPAASLAAIQDAAINATVEEIYKTGSYDFKNGSKIDILGSGVFSKSLDVTRAEERTIVCKAILNGILALNPSSWILPAIEDVISKVGRGNGGEAKCE